jgi:hypothetical protein
VAEDLIYFSVPLGPVSVSINGLLRKLFVRKAQSPSDIVAERFLVLFGAHGVAVSQIPRLLPQVGLDHLNSRDSLLGALTNDVLDETGKLFGVEREWLDGVSDRLYASRTIYKRPVNLFRDLATLKRDDDWFPVRALYCTNELNAADNRSQPLVLLLAERIAEFGDEEIMKYRVYSDTWDWSYGPARVQLKAMARLAFLALDCPVPLYRVGSGIMDRIMDGKAVPRSYLTGSPLTNPSLEDFALTVEESGQAKECEELPTVLQYIRETKLDEAAARTVSQQKGEDS